MRIIYGVSGEGYGHATRAREIIKHLEKKGHKVMVLAYGQSYDALHKEFKVHKIQGIHLYFNKDSLNFLKTISHNIPGIKENIKNAPLRDKFVYNFNPDIAITDFEPITSILAYKLGIPLISIDNQHSIIYQKTKVPDYLLPQFLMTKAIIHLMPLKAEAFICISFNNQRPSNKKAYIGSPIIKESIRKISPKIKDHILVYQTKENPELIRTLKKIPEKFIVYGYNKNKTEHNIQFKKPSPSFTTDLANSKAVIASAGFSLISESIYFKKPYFAIPLKGQFEQTINALFLKNSNMGDFSYSPTKFELAQFLISLPKFKKALRKSKISPDEVFITLDKLIKNLVGKL